MATQVTGGCDAAVLKKYGLGAANTRCRTYKASNTSGFQMSFGVSLAATGSYVGSDTGSEPDRVQRLQNTPADRIWEEPSEAIGGAL